MHYCFAPECNHNSSKNACSYFRFPSVDSKEYKKWVEHTRRADRLPTPDDRICSCHFVDNSRKNTPTKFEHNAKKCFEFPSPERKKRSRMSKPPEVISVQPDLNFYQPEPSPSLEPSPSSSVLELKPSFQPEAGPIYLLEVVKPSLPPKPSPTSVLEIKVKPRSLQPKLACGPSRVSEVKPSLQPKPAGGPSRGVLEVKPTFSALNEAEIYFLRQENKNLKEKLEKIGDALTYESIRGNKVKIFQYTGLLGSEHFEALLGVIKRFEFKYYLGWNVTQLPAEDQLLCTLVKLRLDLQLFDLAYRFKVSQTTIQNIVVTYLSILHEVLFLGCMDPVPSRRKNSIGLPPCFASVPNARMVLECTDIDVSVPFGLVETESSTYKQKHSFKVLLGIAPNAAITFVSDLFPGFVSNKSVTRKSGVLSHMVAGDLIVCDKGFDVGDLCEPLGVVDNAHAEQIARPRLFVEKAIGRLRSFRILDLIAPDMREHASKIVQTCAALVNLQNSLLKENEQMALKEKVTNNSPRQMSLSSLS
uniref:THAP-type domain-containing protein n=1 Tax=Cacopsylla melanoneura TaxID=428564 RepID=A0A8D8UX58_9HEMI